MEDFDAMGLGIEHNAHDTIRGCYEDDHERVCNRSIVAYSPTDQ